MRYPTAMARRKQQEEKGTQIKEMNKAKRGLKNRGEKKKKRRSRMVEWPFFFDIAEQKKMMWKPLNYDRKSKAKWKRYLLEEKK